jgi:lipopolysaccharide transport system permease protein
MWPQLSQSIFNRVSTVSLLWVLVRRDIKDRYLGTVSGLLWAFLGPALTLLIYAFVFQTLMKVRVPSAGAAGFVPFLALGLWPWYAFSDALGRGTNAIVGNAALLGKIALPRYVLVLVPVVSSFAVHTLGFIAVTIALYVSGTDILPSGLVTAALCLFGILVLATGLALWLATLNVFLRDVSAMLPQILTLWMLITPIFFHVATLSGPLASLLAHNPMMGWIESIRSALLGLPAPSIASIVEAVAWSVFALFSGVYVFQRAQSNFEDYL